MNYDIVVIGGGIVGLATAYNLISKQSHLKILILEKERDIGLHQTGHNSGVIHSGLYYQPGSLKALNCIKGYHQLTNFCRQHEIEFELCGKIVVATDTSELPLLENLYQRGLKNGLDGLHKISQEMLVDYEPHVNGLEGLWVPQTGIIDYLQVAQKLTELLKDQGVTIECNQKVIDIRIQKRTEVLTENNEYLTQWVISCAGLYSDQVTRMTQPNLDVRIIPFRGEYYELKPEKEHLVKNLIYPVPDPNFPFLGVHFTRMIKGGVEAGPNAVLAFRREGYTKLQVKPGELWNTLRWPGFQKVAFKYWQTGLGELYRSFSKSAFTKALQKLVPEVNEDDLVPGHTGVRAQASSRDGGLLDDFKIIENQTGVHVCNAPSPAATSALAIGETVSELLLVRL